MHNRMQGEEQQLRIELALPPGFRFFPTDEELITCYLARKAMDGSFTTAAIRDVDLYKTEPWDLPCTLQHACLFIIIEWELAIYPCSRATTFNCNV